jgi:hypothetical protein
MRQLLALILFSLLAPLAFAADFKVEAVGALTDKSVSDAVRATLEDKGTRVIGEDGKPFCEVWLRKDVPTTKDEPMGAIFGQIQEGAVVGVIRFLRDASDYRGQGVKPGYYVMRYTLILSDGAHLGVSPTRDFVLLTPASADADPKPLSQQETIKLSRQASGTGHPSPWSLVQPSANDGLPKVQKADEGHVVLEFKLKTQAGALPMGLVIVGKAEG